MNITDLNKVDVLIALYNAAKISMSGFFALNTFTNATLDRARAEKLLSEKIYFDYIDNRELKVNLTDILKTFSYNRANGPNAAENAIKALMTNKALITNQMKLESMGYKAEIPKSMICPLSLTIITIPVYDPRCPQQVFDKAQLAEALRHDPRHPITRQDLSIEEVQIDSKLQKHINNFMEIAPFLNEVHGYQPEMLEDKTATPIVSFSNPSFG